MGAARSLQYLFLSLSCKYLNTPRGRTILLLSVWSAGVFIWWILLWSRVPTYFCQIAFPLSATFKTVFSFFFFFFLIFLFRCLYFWETVKVFSNWNTIRNKNGQTEYLGPIIVAKFHQNVFVVCLFVLKQHFPQSGESRRFGWCSVTAWTVDSVCPN